MKKISNYIPTFLIVITIVAIFRSFFFDNLYPFPGNFLLAWFEPWKTENISNGVISIPHKPVGDDVFRQIYPFKVLGMEMIKKMELPLWNPYNGAGTPLFATAHIGFLNPFNVVFFLFENHLAWSFFIILQLFLIGFLMYLYSRKIALSQKASLLSTFSFLFSGFVITRSIYGDYDYAIATLPLLLYLIESYIQDKSKKILLLPLVVSFLFFSVQPQITFYILIFFYTYSIYRLHKTHQFFLKSFFYISSLCVIGIGISSIQIIPTLELLFNSSLNVETSKFIFLRFLLPLHHFISVAIPNYFGNQSTYNYWGYGDYIESIVSIGSVPIFFALFSAFKRKENNLVVFFSFGAIISMILSLNWTVTRFIYELQIPIVSTGIPSRILFLFVFSISILSGIGYDKLLNQKKLNRKHYVFIIIFVISLIALLPTTFVFLNNQISCKNEAITNCSSIAFRNTALEVFGFFSFLVLFFVTRRKDNLGKLASYIPIFVIVLLGIYNSDKFLPFSKKETFNPQNELIHYLKTKTSNSRIFGYDNASIKTNFATYFHFFDPNYYDPLYNKRYGELVSYVNYKNATSLLRSDVEIVNNAIAELDLKERRKRLFQLLSIRYEIYSKKDTDKDVLKNIVFENPHWIVTENKTILPRAYLIKNAEKKYNDYEILTRLFSSDFDPFSSAIIEGKELPLLKGGKNYEKPVIKNYRQNNVIIETNSSDNSILVLSDNYYPGWKVYVDGKQSKIYRANYTFRSVYLASGKHLVEFKYEPESFKLGLNLTLLSLVAWIIAFKYS